MIVVHDAHSADYGDATRPEKPARVLSVASHLRQTHPDWTWAAPSEVEEGTLLLAHTKELLRRLEVPQDFDEDTPCFPDIHLHARRSVGAALRAAQAALLENAKAFSLMRPPGHHATAAQAMGFCYLNQVAVAAFAARAWGAARVAVWDFDAHHGNGTEAILDGRPGFMVSSVHQFPGYPGTGTRNTATCRNRIVEPHGSREKHLEALEQSWAELLAFKPELVLVSAGFDAYAGDPVASLSLEAGDFATLGSWLRESALPVAAVLEGGYSAELPVLVETFLRAWEGSEGAPGRGAIP